MKVISQGELEYITLANNERMAKMSLVLSDGNDTFEAEAFDRLAASLPRLNGNMLYACSCKLTVREWDSQTSQKKMRATSVRLLNITELV